jgi:hypothetical protein
MAKRIAVAFAAGFVATLVFHQCALLLLHWANVTSRAPWPMNPVPPFGIPAVISLAFWGGVWGVIMMQLLHRRRGSALWIAATLFGAIFPTLVAILIVAPLKHMPVGGPNASKLLMVGLLVNAAWGLGTALIYRVFIKR